ncbi:MAG: hypothetical protein JSV91_15810 [Phycisphaerales bacterium]|nr:MAG: hypothetical protein JSV91_15810 [Phycisphaerales bacterium]
MTLTTHPVSDFVPHAPVHRVVEVRWASVQPLSVDRAHSAVGKGSSCQRHEVVLELQIIDDEHAMLEMWIQTPARRKQVVPRRLARCEVTEDGEMTHIDARLDGWRAAAISIGDDDRLVYARSDLLTEEAGLAGGAYHPPTLTCRLADPDAATA